MSESTTAFGPLLDAKSDAASDVASKATMSTGTTTVGLVAADGVVLATDRRASLGGRFVSNKDAQKVEQVHPTAAVTIAGSVGGAQAFLRTLRAEASLYEYRRGEPMNVEALATLAGTLVRGMPVTPLLGGMDETGPRLYQLDPAGGVLENRYAATGSGMQVALGSLEREYDPEGELSVEVAGDLGVAAVRAASERDTASGNGVALATVTAEGVAFEEAD